MSVRALLGRPAESLLLMLGVALAVGATAAGITLAETTRAQSEELLASPRYREIVVATRAETSSMELPVRVRAATDVVLTVADLEPARTATQAIQYAYLANPTGFLLGEMKLPDFTPPPEGTTAGKAPLGGASADGSVQVFVFPAAPQQAQRTATPSAETAADGAGADAPPKFDLPKEFGIGEPLLPAPDGPQPLPEYLPGLEVTPEFFAARRLTPAAGSLFTDADMGRGEPILVLGSELGTTLFADGKSLGRQVLSLNRLYRIVGILEPTGTEVDQQAFAPAPLAAERLGGLSIKAPALNTSLRFTVADPAHLEKARAQLTSHFDAAYGEGAVSISIPRSQAESAADRYRRLVGVILFLALSALLIAAVNMTNIFYSRGVRRQRSVGILKALGASVAQVFGVFFLEALAIGALGAAAGLGIAALLSRLMEQTIGFGALHIGLIIAGVAASWTIVTACNLLPAAAAARMPAADAIRYE